MSLQTLNSQIINEITGTTEVWCAPKSGGIAIKLLISDQNDGFFFECAGEIRKVHKYIYDNVAKNMIDKRDFITCPFDFSAPDGFLTKLGFTQFKKNL